MPLQPFAPHRSPLMPNAMRNSSLFRRMMRGSWVSDTERCDGGAAPAAALIVKTAKRASGIVFMGTSCFLRMGGFALAENIAAPRCGDKRGNLAQCRNLLMCWWVWAASVLRLVVRFVRLIRFHCVGCILGGLLGCSGDFLRSLLRRGCHFVCDLLRRSGHSMSGIFGGLRRGIGVALD